MVHDPACAIHGLIPAEAADIPDAVAAEDGYPRMRAAILHPTHAATRRHFAARPLPTQQNRRAS
ncbi:hypothetical protein ATE80_13210 [Streptomyces kanasensis]|uniref:Uncharacterized protein n=1 Tax=Streptomyces kanasensis TaxID=936756 RepID=A0A124ECQ6_9ACTN|nr:hypothetical protein ATE80_13210 [Streptomyces kanasensis]